MKTDPFSLLLLLLAAFFLSSLLTCLPRVFLFYFPCNVPLYGSGDATDSAPGQSLPVVLRIPPTDLHTGVKARDS